MDVGALKTPLQAAKLPLEQLAANPNVSDQQKVAEVSRQFEAILVRQILSQGQKTVFPSAYVSGGAATGIYQDMVNTQMADRISESGSLGIAKMLNRQLSHENLKDKPPAPLTPTTAKPGLSVPVPTFELHHE